jgi:hypothetical protein
MQNGNDIHSTWLRTLKPGDVIQIIPRALYQGWVNVVREAEIEVLGRQRAETFSPTQEPSIQPHEIYKFIGGLMKNEIRLLSIGPGSKEDPVSCWLSRASLANDYEAPFESLSYCWGDPGNRVPIKLKVGPEHDGTQQAADEYDFEVTENLFAALKALRSEAGKSRVIWVDAICINQAHIEERNQQVALMRTIYSKATQVVIWLGENSSLTGPACNSAKAFSEALEKDQCAFLSELSTSKPHGVEGNAAWAHIHTGLFFTTPWFKRAWVVQEVFNARSALVQWGDFTIPWSVLLRINDCLTKSKAKHGQMGHTTMPYVLSNIFRPDGVGNVFSFTKEHDLDTLDIIVGGIDLGCSDPRDKIFSLIHLGRDTDELPTEIRPDYTKTCANVFMDFTRHCITSTGSLRILSAIHASFGRTWQRITWSSPQDLGQGRPSWSIWYSGISSWAYASLGLSRSCRYQASGSAALEIATPDRRTLKLGGILLGTITGINAYAYLENRASESEIQQVFVSLFDPIGEAQTWTPSATTQNHSGEDQRPRALQWHANTHIRHLRAGNPGFSCTSDCFFTAEGPDGHKRVGLCPYSARTGDKIVVLFGGQVPFILRELRPNGASELNGQYILVGEAYCDEYMYGKALEDVENGGLRRDTFELI